MQSCCTNFLFLLQEKAYLVVLAIGLALGVEDTGPVLGLEVGLGVDIDLNLNVGSLLLDGEGGDTDGVEETAEELADAGGAPRADDLTSLQGELGAEDGVLDGGAIDLAEGKGLDDGGALVAEGVDRARGVDGNADGKAAGDTRARPMASTTKYVFFLKKDEENLYNKIFFRFLLGSTT